MEVYDSARLLDQSNHRLIILIRDVPWSGAALSAQPRYPVIDSNPSFSELPYKLR
ncbi:hypothetical protein ACFL2B_02435 [Patescibacteria group bacterium]